MRNLNGSSRAREDFSGSCGAEACPERPDDVVCRICVPAANRIFLLVNEVIEMFELRAVRIARLGSRGRGVGGLLGFALVVFGFCSAVASAGEDEMVAKGRQIAEAACSPCHAVGPSGASPKAEAPLFRELGRKYPVDSLQETLAEGVLVGHPEMPEVKMTEAEIGAFIAYLKTIQVP